MSLERKDIRAKLDPDMHAAMTVLAEIDQIDLGEFIERVVSAEVKRRVHDATLIAERVACLGITGNRRESQGKTGRAGE